MTRTRRIRLKITSLYKANCTRKMNLVYDRGCWIIAVGSARSKLMSLESVWLIVWWTMVDNGSWNIDEAGRRIDGDSWSRCGWLLTLAGDG